MSASPKRLGILRQLLICTLTSCIAVTGSACRSNHEAKELILLPLVPFAVAGSVIWAPYNAYNASKENQAKLVEDAVIANDLPKVQALFNQWPDVRDGKLRWGPVHTASKHGRIEILQWLLANGAKADPINPRAESGLMAASQPEIAELLLAHGASLRREYYSERTPLHQAVEHGRLAVVEVLLKHGADPNQPDAYGNTAVHEAARPDHRTDTIVTLGMLNLLIAHNGDINATNEQGKTPLDLAIRRRIAGQEPVLAARIRQLGGLPGN